MDKYTGPTLDGILAMLPLAAKLWPDDEELPPPSPEAAELARRYITIKPDDQPPAVQE